MGLYISCSYTSHFHGPFDVIRNVPARQVKGFSKVPVAVIELQQVIKTTTPLNTVF
jgi:hypothetical protein